MKTLVALVTFVLAATAALATTNEPAQPLSTPLSTPPAYSLPSYALGQPLAEARLVIPQSESASTWTLRCSGDPDAPPELAAAADQAGAMVCWPFRLTPAGAVRAATLPRRLGATEELEFRQGRVVRITQLWRRADGTSGSVTFSDPATAGH